MNICRENQEKGDRTIYLVTDTSWWLDQGWKRGYGFFRYLTKNGIRFVISVGVLRQLDGLKKNSRCKKQAGEALKRIWWLTERLKAAEFHTVSWQGAQPLADKTDLDIIATAKAQKEKGEGEVILLTTDLAQKAVASSLGIKSGFDISLTPARRPPWWAGGYMIGSWVEKRTKRRNV